MAAIKFNVKLSDLDLFKGLVAVLKKVTTDSRIDEVVRSEYEKEILALMSENEGGG